MGYIGVITHLLTIYILTSWDIQVLEWRIVKYLSHQETHRSQNNDS